MIFCGRTDCKFNDDGGCENPDSITLNDEGTCTDYVYHDFWDDLDDIERSEYMRTIELYREDGETE